MMSNHGKVLVLVALGAVAIRGSGEERKTDDTMDLKTPILQTGARFLRAELATGIPEVPENPTNTPAQHDFSLTLAPSNPAPPRPTPFGASLSNPSLGVPVSRETEKRMDEMIAQWKVLDSQRLDAENRTDFADTMKRVFSPDPALIKVGHLELTGGLINAIEHRNPLCLINIWFIRISF